MKQFISSLAAKKLQLQLFLTSFFSSRKTLLFLFPVVVGFNLFTGCASALKERCENMNWFEHSRDVALDGRYLEEDALIKDCKGIDTISSVQIDQGFKSGRERYCTYEGFLRRGESGDLVNFKMCDELILKQMQERYGQGLIKFCTPDVGYAYGASGKVYQHVCFKNSEKDFLPKYYQGRKEYLIKMIAQTQIEINDLKQLQTSLEPQIQLLSLEINHLPSPQECSSVQVYNEQLKKNESQTVCHEAYYIQSRRSSLYSQINSFRQQFRNHAQVLTKSFTYLQQYRLQLTQIPTTPNLP